MHLVYYIRVQCTSYLRTGASNLFLIKKSLAKIKKQGRRIKLHESHEQRAYLNQLEHFEHHNAKIIYEPERV